uniref:NADH-ubiquinone oxidoreductase chain 4L n=1 Tax=Ceratosolen solmsi TaxID=142686 RepID=D1FKC2_9HYME|nr:NADH dehydrogenase subunit 4L [Ceratosolen solmsi]
MFLISMILLSGYFKAIIMVLLMMEYMMFSLLLFMFYIMWNMMNLEIVIYYLIVAVCESVFGMTVMVLLIRSSGTSMMNSLNLMLW